MSNFNVAKNGGWSRRGKAVARLEPGTPRLVTRECHAPPLACHPNEESFHPNKARKADLAAAGLGSQAQEAEDFFLRPGDASWRPWCGHLKGCSALEGEPGYIHSQRQQNDEQHSLRLCQPLRAGLIAVKIGLQPREEEAHSNSTSSRP